MLAYAASRPVVVGRHPHPNTMLLIIGAHVALIAAVMSARMEIQIRKHPDPPLIRVPLAPDPPVRPQVKTKIQQRTSSARPIDETRIRFKDPSTQFQPPPITGPTTTDGGLGGGGVAVIPDMPHPTAHMDPTLPRLLTPTSELKPPYPAEKLLNEEEAVLTLKLAIDAQGRVTSVEPVGHADMVFLEAARRYLVAHWRYSPATREGIAIATTTIVTLHFELNG